MQEYLSLQKEVLRNGVHKQDRTGTGTISVPGVTRRYDIRHETVAAVTTKTLHFKTGLVEEEWMMSGDTTLKFLKDNNCNIWDEWVKPGTGTYRSRTVKEMERAYKRDHFGFDKPGVLDMGWTTSDNWKLVAERPDFRIWLWTNTAISTPEHRIEDLSEDYENWIKWADAEDPIWIEFYKALGISDQEVVDGELGEVYGAMFRNIPDVRMLPTDLPEEEVKALWKRGFEYMGDMTPVSEEASATTQSIWKRRIDQVQNLIDGLRDNPDSRRHILCPWNPAYVDEQALPPCHSFIQFWTRDLSAEERYSIYSHRSERLQREVIQRATENPECLLSNMYTHVMIMPRSIWFSGNKTYAEATAKMTDFLDSMNVPKKALTCILYQRSADIFLGVPYNLTFYSILTHKLARQLGMWGEELVHMIGDAHIYDNHIDQVHLQQSRDPSAAPYLKFKKPEGTSILEYTWKDVEIVGYFPHPAIPAPIAV